MKMKKLIYVPIMTLIVIANLLLIYIAFMMFYPFDIVDMQTFEVKQEQVTKGDFVKVHMVFDKKISAQPKVRWLLVDGMTHELNVSSKPRPEGQQEVEASLYIPDNPSIVEASHQITAVMEYDVFPLRQPIVYIWTTNDFQIVERSQ